MKKNTTEVLKDIYHLFGDNPELHEIPRALARAAEIVESLAGMTGPEKKVTVVEAVREVVRDVVVKHLHKHDMPWYAPDFIVDPLLEQIIMHLYDELAPRAVDAFISACNGEFDI